MCRFSPKKAGRPGSQPDDLLSEELWVPRFYPRQKATGNHQLSVICPKRFLQR